MAPTRTAIAASGALAATLTLLGACQSKRALPTHSHAYAPPLSVSAAPKPAAALAASVVLQTLRSVHDEKLRITAPISAPQRLEFGSARLAQADGSDVVFRDTARGELVSRATIGAVRAIAHGSDGSLFAVGAKDGVRLDPHVRAPAHFARPVFLPGALLFPVLEDPSQFDVYVPAAQEILRCPFQGDAGVVSAGVAQFPLERCAGALMLLRDGAYVCRTGAGFARKAPRGHGSEYLYTPQFGEPLRLIPAKRLDEFYSVSESGEVVQLRLAPGVPTLAHFSLPAPPYAAAGNGEVLAFLMVSLPLPGHVRVWTLLVTDLQGQPRLSQEIAARTATASDDWLEAVVADKNLALSSFEPLVAVGGASELRVWDYTQGQPRFAL